MFMTDTKTDSVYGSKFTKTLASITFMSLISYFEMLEVYFVWGNTHVKGDHRNVFDVLFRFQNKKSKTITLISSHCLRSSSSVLR